jgi:hypothetical protein
MPISNLISAVSLRIFLIAKNMTNEQLLKRIEDLERRIMVLENTRPIYPYYPPQLPYTLNWPTTPYYN